MYKTVQINRVTKVFCVTAYPCVSISVPWQSCEHSGSWAASCFPAESEHSGTTAAALRGWGCNQSIPRRDTTRHTLVVLIQGQRNGTWSQTWSRGSWVHSNTWFQLRLFYRSMSRFGCLFWTSRARTDFATLMRCLAMSKVRNISLLSWEISLELVCDFLTWISSAESGHWRQHVMMKCRFKLQSRLQLNFGWLLGMGQDSDQSQVRRNLCTMMSQDRRPNCGTCLC